jgi:alcohol dehydrogenase (NADP+)
LSLYFFQYVVLTLKTAWKYSPLGSKDRNPAFKGLNEPSLLENPEIMSIANDHGCSPGQVLIKWAIQRGTIVIPKSVNPGRINQNFDAASLELSSDAMSRINAMDRHFRYIDGSIWAMPGSPYTVESLWDESGSNPD